MKRPKINILKIDPALKMQACGWIALVGTAMGQVWHDNEDIVRVAMFLTSVGASAGVLMARHRHVSDEASGATERFYKKHFGDAAKKRLPKYFPRHD